MGGWSRRDRLFSGNLMSIILKPVIGSSGRHTNIDTGIDNIFSREVVVDNGIPKEKDVYIGYVMRQPDAGAVITAKVPESVILLVRLALAERDAAITGKSKLDHNTRKICKIPTLEEALSEND